MRIGEHAYTLSWEYWLYWYTYLAAEEGPIVGSYEFVTTSDEEAIKIAKEKIHSIHTSPDPKRLQDGYVMFSASLHRRIPLGNISSG